jgi:hypothetical protein
VWAPVFVVMDSVEMTILDLAALLFLEICVRPIGSSREPFSLVAQVSCDFLIRVSLFILFSNVTKLRLFILCFPLFNMANTRFSPWYPRRIALEFPTNSLHECDDHTPFVTPISTEITNISPLSRRSLARPVPIRAD